MQSKKKRAMILFRRDVVLRKLAEAGAVTVDKLFTLLRGAGSVADAMLAPYYASYGALRGRGHRSYDYDREDGRVAMAAFRVMMSRLKKEKLVSRSADGVFSILKNGEKYLATSSSRPSWLKTYKPVAASGSKNLCLVIFDIPERKRIFRDWLRYQLAELEFRRLQHSVWWGMGALPEEFMNDLRQYKLLSYVHIFSVTQRGTIADFLERIGHKS